MQPAQFFRFGRRACVLAASVLLLSLPSLTGSAVAQEGDNRAGLVVQFGDGSVYTACVDLGSDGQATGEEVLRASGLGAVIDYGSGFGGGTVCRIGDEGCSFPAEKCFCQCTMKPGDPCIYWSYFHLLEGQWRYAIAGASGYVVGSGDVEGWAWGAGSAGSGVQPPLIAFEQVCGAPASPTSEPAVPRMTSTALPSVTSTAAQPTATALPTNTAPPSATPVPNQFPQSTDTPLSETAVSSPQPSVSPSRTPAPSATPLAKATLEPGFEATASPIPGELAFGPEDESLAPTDQARSATASPNQGEKDSQQTTSYLFFGLLVVALVIGGIFLRIRQRH